MTAQVRVSRWGNSLAVRLPGGSLKSVGLEEGDLLLLETSPDGRLVLTPKVRRLSETQLRRLRRFLSRQKPTAAVVAQMRENARY